LPHPPLVRNENSDKSVIMSRITGSLVSSFHRVRAIAVIFICVLGVNVRGCPEVHTVPLVPRTHPERTVGAARKYPGFQERPGLSDVGLRVKRFLFQERPGPDVRETTMDGGTKGCPKTIGNRTYPIEGGRFGGSYPLSGILDCRMMIYVDLAPGPEMSGTTKRSIARAPQDHWTGPLT